MKIKKVSTVLAFVSTTVLLAGCVVTSVSPFYTGKDVVFEPAVVGDWVSGTKEPADEVWKFEKGEGKAYRFTLIGKDKATVMEAHAFKLQGQLLLDIASVERDYHVIPPHLLLKVVQTKPTLKLSALNHDWVMKLLEKEPAAIAHQFVQNGEQPNDLRAVLTADSETLQKFIAKYLETKEAWDDGSEFTRQSGS
ncbi:MAG TPA: hypothetical protein VFE51_16460 [Verrucomicrobiae bacterium]|nr:hypothetical protein [Verrucomicrobiae bacterium]